MVQLVHPRHDLRREVVDRYEAVLAARAGFGDLEDLAFRLVEHLGGRLPHGTERGIRDLGADRGEAAHDRALAHDLGVAPDVGGAGRIGGERAQVGMAPGVGELAAALEALGDRQCVGRLAALDQSADVLEDGPVVGAVEIGPGDDVRDPVPRRVVEEQAAQHGLLGFDRLRRHARGFDLGILQDRSDDLSHEAPRSRKSRRAKAMTPLVYWTTRSGWRANADSAM